MLLAAFGGLTVCWKRWLRLPALILQRHCSLKMSGLNALLDQQPTLQLCRGMLTAGCRGGCAFSYDIIKFAARPFRFVLRFKLNRNVTDIEARPQTLLKILEYIPMSCSVLDSNVLRKCVHSGAGRPH